MSVSDDAFIAKLNQTAVWLSVDLPEYSTALQAASICVQRARIHLEDLAVPFLAQPVIIWENDWPVPNLLRTFACFWAASARAQVTV